MTPKSRWPQPGWDSDPVWQEKPDRVQRFFEFREDYWTTQHLPTGWNEAWEESVARFAAVPELRRTADNWRKYFERR